MSTSDNTSTCSLLRQPLKMGEFGWTNAMVISLVEEYKKRPELWNPAHEMYRVQTLKYESWQELASAFECDMADLRKKLNSLLASHRREKAKVRAGGRSSWFLYPYMSFLPSHLECDAGEDTANQKSPPTVQSKAETQTSDDEDNDDETYEEETIGQYEDVIIKQEELVREQVKTKSRKFQTHKPRLIKPIKRRRIIKESVTPNTQLDTRLAEALKLLRKSDLTKQKDECDSFGEYIANSLRKHDDRTQSMIKQAINNILFEQEMKKYSGQYMVISTVEENPLILTDVTEK